MAQKVSGSFKPLQDLDRVKMVIDFSQADIMGMSEEEFYIYEEDWAKDKPEVLSLFFGYANKALKGNLILGNYNNDSYYLLALYIRSVNVKGDYDCDLSLLCEGVEIARAIKIGAKGGKFGSKLNLMKDGAEHTGKALGQFLLGAIKRGNN